MYNQEKNFRVDGYVMFRYDSMLDSIGAKCMTKILDKVWMKSALTPTYDSYTYDSVDEAATIKTLKLNSDGTYTIEYDKIDDAKAYTNKGNDAWQALSDDDDKDYHLDYDMYDFLYALFRGLEGNANRNPKNPLGHTIRTFSPTSEDSNEKGTRY